MCLILVIYCTQIFILKGVFAKNERGYRLPAKKKHILVLLQVFIYDLTYIKIGNICRVYGRTMNLLSLEFLEVKRVVRLRPFKPVIYVALVKEISNIQIALIRYIDSFSAKVLDHARMNWRVKEVKSSFIILIPWLPFYTRHNCF